jgi:hypothetical protein
MRWKRHEELVQLQVSDRPTTPTSLLKEEQQHDSIEQTTTPIITAFAYASTPPLNIDTTPEFKKRHLNNRSSWKNRLSLISPSSFLKINNNSSTGSFNSSNIL